MLLDAYHFYWNNHKLLKCVWCFPHQTIKNLVVLHLLGFFSRIFKPVSQLANYKLLIIIFILRDLPVAYTPYIFCIFQHLQKQNVWVRKFGKLLPHSLHSQILTISAILAELIFCLNIYSTSLYHSIVILVMSSKCIDSSK